MHLDILLGHALLGGPNENPIKENARRDMALTEGQKCKLLLSYVRTRALKNSVSKHSDVSYLKDLANRRKPFIKSPSSCTTLALGSSPRSLDDSSDKCLVFDLAKTNLQKECRYVPEKNISCVMSKVLSK